MNNRFKYRIWNKKGGCFVSEYANILNECKLEYFVDSTGKLRKLIYNIVYGVSEDNIVEPENYVVQYSSGLVDSIGKEIFEGDLIKTSKTLQTKIYDINDIYKKNVIAFEEPRVIENIRKVVFSEITDRDDFYCPDMIGWGLSDGSGNVSSLIDEQKIHIGVLVDTTYYKIIELKFEVVGNIFENPNLLTKTMNF